MRYKILMGLFLLLLAPAMASAVDLTTDLTLCYDLEANGAESVSGENLSTTGSPTYGTGKIGNAMTPASGGYLNGTISTFTAANKNMTVTWWENVTSTAAGVAGVWTIGDQTTVDAGNFLFYHLGAVNTLNLQTTAGSDYQFNNIGTNTWYFMAARWNNNTQTMELFQDNVSQSVVGGGQNGGGNKT